MSTVAPFGTWKSPITSAAITGKAMGLEQVRVDGPMTYWVESRTAQGGRNTLLRRYPDGSVVDVLPMTPTSQLVDVRTRVHEYGGRAYAVANDTIVVSHGGDGCLYRYTTGERLMRRLTPAVDHRYGDFELDTVRGVIYAVREDHTDPAHPRNELVVVPLDGSAHRDLDAITVLWQSTDFVAGTALSPDGRYLAFTTWSHPNMAWTQAALHVAELDFVGAPAHIHTLVDEPGVMTSQPRWTLAGDLIHIDDSTGWANLYRTEGFLAEGEEPGTDWASRLRTRALHPAAKAFSGPAWRLGLHTFDNFDHNHLICSWSADGTSHLGTVRLDNGELEEWHTAWHPAGNVACADGRVVMLADSPHHHQAVVEVYRGETTLVRSSTDIEADARWVSVPETISWQSPDGAQAHGFYYPPCNPDFTGPEGAKPPLIVMVHGGPTAAARPTLSLEKQFWTSRGFAIVDVNYRGSTGYGRPYRDSLNGNWGVYDVADCIGAVEYLRDRIDTDRVAIRGASAGGFTALSAVASSQVFTAATSLFGIGDLRKLAENTHKFESKYLQMLLASNDFDDPIWAERSPINHADKIRTPLLLLQGDQDKIVPVSQALELHDKLEDHGVKARLVVYPGEGHGFRSAAAIRGALRAELEFYREVWGIQK